MISVLRAPRRHHGRRHKREIWRTLDPLQRSGRPGADPGVLDTLDENRLPPFAEVARLAQGEAEIITYVREGAGTCEDSMGHVSVIQSGEFQCMSEVPAMRHRETNASRSAWAHVFQVRL